MQSHLRDLPVVRRIECAVLAPIALGAMLAASACEDHTSKARTARAEEKTPMVPTLGQVNLVVRDVRVSAAFYRVLGLPIEEASRPEWQAHHAAAILPNGTRIELDSFAFARQWNPGFVARTEGGGAAVIFIYMPTSEAVDEVFRRVVAAGYRSQKDCDDAFWGARYAIVEDPDGNAVGIMGPMDPTRRRPPPPPPPG
jgi:uncharacterized glyoxalase superfamily protein PhnB